MFYQNEYQKRQSEEDKPETSTHEDQNADAGSASTAGAALKNILADPETLQVKTIAQIPPYTGAQNVGK